MEGYVEAEQIPAFTTSQIAGHANLDIAEKDVADCNRPSDYRGRSSSSTTTTAPRNSDNVAAVIEPAGSVGELENGSDSLTPTQTSEGGLGQQQEDSEDATESGQQSKDPSKG
jgi:hypothetical protein